MTIGCSQPSAPESIGKEAFRRHRVLQRIEKGFAVAEPRSFEWYRDMDEADRLIALDFPTKPAIRHPLDGPIYTRIYDEIAGGKDGYLARLRSLLKFKENFARIPNMVEGMKPGWINDWIPGWDAVTLYGFVAQRKPNRYIEIGSGISTTFVRRAIVEHRLDTKIISIDPDPRHEIDAICDSVMRLPLEQVDREFFDDIDQQDIVFCDNSHRSFQSSDVTVFMTEVLPTLIGKDVLVGVHDIFLPYDYPENWLARYYNEHYLLVGYVLGRVFDIVLPCYFCSREQECSRVLEFIWDLPGFRGGNPGGGIFWMSSRTIP